MEIIKVSSKSAPHAVAGAIANVVREKTMAEIQSVGAGATNQAIKSIAIARGYLAPSGIDIVCVPGFANVDVGGETRTAMRLIVKSISTHKPASSGLLANAFTSLFLKIIFFNVLYYSAAVSENDIGGGS